MGNVSTVGYVIKTLGNTYNTSDILVTDDRFPLTLKLMMEL